MPKRFQLTFGEPGGYDIIAEFKDIHDALDFLIGCAKWHPEIDGDEIIVRATRAVSGSIEYTDDNWRTWVVGKEIE